VTTEIVAERAQAEKPRLLLLPRLVPCAPLPRWKRALDLALVVPLLVVTLPLQLAIVAAIMLDSRGAPIYRHTRVGRGGSHFTCWKFRSMVRDAHALLPQLAEQNEARGQIFKMRDDPRRTRVGRVLRRTSLDELPQLWNVLAGDMTLVGPRPPLPEEVVHYSEQQLLRLGGTPGITGLWQVRARARHDFDEMVELDIEYLARVSLLGDLKILLATIPTVLGGRGSY
jgi:lipopolysaccharide/colanic/teichoic acid biosynthesis glycosyltransferase